MHKFLGEVVIIIFNQLYSGTDIIRTMNRYETILSYTRSMTMFGTVISVMKTLAIGITVLLFFIDLGDKVAEKNFSIEHLFKSMLRYYVSFIFIMQSDTIITYLLRACTDVATSITTTGGASYNFFEKDVNRTMFINGLANIDVVNQLGYLADCLIPWILCMIAQVIIQFVLISRILEITVYTMFAPIALADVYKEGTRSSGVRFIKKLFALGLQVVVIILINEATQAIVLAVNSGTADSIFGLLKVVELESGDPVAALSSGALVFTKESIQEFLNVLLGGTSYAKTLGIMCARLGLIFGSLPLCEEITGAR